MRRMLPTPPRIRFGPLRVVVVVGSPALRSALVEWLRGARVTIVAAVSSANELLDAHRANHLVVATALDGPGQLRAVARKLDRGDGLVALTLSRAPLPAGWIPVSPGVTRRDLLAHAGDMPRGVRIRLAGGVVALWAGAVAAVAAVSAVVYVPIEGVSFQRIALAYASLYPDAGTWWHVWGAGAPLLATPSWPVMKAGALLPGGPERFVLLSAALGAVMGVALFLALLRLGAGRAAPLLAAGALAAPAMWMWPRGGDAASLLGPAGVALALAATYVGRQRVLATVLAIAVAAPAGYLWVVLAALAPIGISARDGRWRTAAAGSILGIIATSAVTVPPILARGLPEGLVPSLARPLALSDLSPAIVAAAVIAVALARRIRRVALALTAIAVVGLSVLTPFVPLQSPEPPLEAIGPHGRVAATRDRALALLARQPDLSVTGDGATPSLLLGLEPKLPTQARLEWLAVDRAMVPDRSAAVIFNERDWSLVDRDRLVMQAPLVRPVLTAATTPAFLVVAEEADARRFSDAIVAIGSSSDIIIPVRSLVPLDDLDRDFLRKFTALVIYGRPWRSEAKAASVLQSYIDGAGFVIWDTAGRPGPQPLFPAAKAIDQPERYGTGGERGLLLSEDRFAGGTVVAMPAFDLEPNWEYATLLAGNERVILYGITQVGRVVWSGADLPGRAVAGDGRARLQLEKILVWILQNAQIQFSGGWPRPSGTELRYEGGTATFVSPTKWRLELTLAATGILFKESPHPQWRATQVDGVVRTQLPVLPVTHGAMYVPLPANARVVELTFERHPAEGVTRGVSAAALFVTAGIAFFVWRQRR